MTEYDYYLTAVKEDGVSLFDVPYVYQTLEHEKTETACQMKADGMSSDLIVKYTGLTAEEIEAL